MTRHSVETIVAALNAHGVRYLIGGLAVVAHGYVRFTADVDVIVDMSTENVSAAISALEALGYRPHAPVPFHDLVEADKREQWVREKGLTVFSLYSAAHPATEVDIFVRPPLDFNAAYAAAVYVDIAPNIQAAFVSLDDLLRLKSQAGRPQDLEDIRQLEALRKGPDA